MIETLREFAIKLSADIDNKSFKEVTQTVDETAKSVTDFATNIVGALTAGAFAMAVKSTVDQFNAVSDAASRMGTVTATELDRIGYIAGRTGSNAETATESFEELSKIIGEGANGIGGGKGFFEDYGLNARNADGSVKTVTQFFDELKVKTADWTQAQKVALLQQAGMDKSLVGMLSTDTDLIALEYDKRTHALGINADEIGSMSAEFNDHLGRMTRSFQDVLTAVVVRILPPITDAFKVMTKWVTDSGGTIVKIIEPFTAVLRVMVRMINGALVSVGSFIDIFGGLPAYVALATVAWKAFNAVMNASPLMKFITIASAVVSVIGLLIDDFRTAREGGQSFFKFWNQPFFDSFLKAGESVTDFFKHLAGIFIDSGNRLENFKALWGDLSTFLLSFWDGLAGSLEHVFKSFFPNAHETIVDFEKAFSEGATAIVDGIKDFIENSLDRISKSVTDWVDGIGDKIKGAFSGVANFFGFGDDEKGGGVLDSKYANSAGAIPVGSTAHQAVTNHVNNTVNQSFNVANRETASFIARDSTLRFAGGAS